MVVDYIYVHIIHYFNLKIPIKFAFLNLQVKFELRS